MRGFVWKEILILMGAQELCRLVQSCSGIGGKNWSITGYDSQNRFSYTRFRSRFFVHKFWGRYTFGVHSPPTPAAVDLISSHRS